MNWAFSARRSHCRTGREMVRPDCKPTGILSPMPEEGPADHLLMVDCYLSLDVPYAIQLADAIAEFKINWIEEPLQADNVEGSSKQLKAAHPRMKWTTGEHEYTRYGFRQLISGRHIDILQPDVMWAGGLTELLRICAMASAYDIPVVPHCSGPYSNHLVISQPNCPFSEFLITSPRGEEVGPTCRQSLRRGDPSGERLD